MNKIPEKNILLITNDIDLGKALQKYTKKLGYNISFFESGASGLQHAKVIKNFHLVIVSQDLADIAGYKIISILRKQDLKCQMFLLAENISQADYNSFIKYGADAIFSFPLNFGVLLIEIDNAIKKFEPENDKNFSNVDFPEISLPAKFHFTVRDISETGCRFHSHFCIEKNSIIILCSAEISDKLALPLDTIFPIRVMNCSLAQNGKGYELGGIFIALQEKVYTRLHQACRSAKGFKFTAFN